MGRRARASTRALNASENSNMTYRSIARSNEKQSASNSAARLQLLPRIERPNWRSRRWRRAGEWRSRRTRRGAVGLNSDNRVKAVAEFGFTERQARFLVTVMLHSGLCVPRQYASFARTA